MLLLLYAALGIFVAGNLYRIIRISRMPVHLRWELFPIPTGRAGKLKFSLSEVLLLRGVWEHNRPLWLWSWLLHWGLYLLICSATLTVIRALLSPLVSQELTTVSSLTSLVACISALCGTCGSVGLFMLRGTNPVLRMFTSRATLFNLGIILAVFATALAMLALERGAAHEMSAMAGALLMLRPAPLLSVSGTVHLCVVALFLAYFPFTQMTHMYLKYFAYHSVRWDDAPLYTVPGMEQKLNRTLDLAAHWSAPHIRAAGGKTWKAITAEDIPDVCQKTRN